MAKDEGTPRILVIDDEEGIREMLSQALDIGGYDVVTAADGQEGIDTFEKDRSFWLILTDLMMPRLNGMQVLERARKLDPDVEVIVLTGFGGQESAIEAMKKGAYDYLQKPTNVEELFITVQKALERRRLSAENREYQRNLERLVKQRTHELTETKNFLQSVLDSSVDYSIIATDLDGRITLFNRGSERLLGYDASEVEGKETMQLFAPEGPEGEALLDVADVEAGAVPRQEVERVVKRKDGGEITVSLSVSGLTDQDGRLVGAIWIAKDITEQKKLELEIQRYTENLENLVEERTQELESRNRELEETVHELHDTQQQLVQSEKLASLGQLAAGVAHEINNPIGFIHSNLGSLSKYTDRLTGLLEEVRDRLKSGDGISEEQFEELWRKSKIDFILEDIETIIGESLDGTSRVRTIVKDLKSFSNLDRAQIQEADLEEGLESTLNIVRNEVKYKADVDREFAGIPRVTCNSQQINQVFLNLLMNAAQAIKEPPGQITLRTEKLDGERVAIDIEDDGVGIPEDQLGKIFDPFFTTKEVGEGTGLGLSISYRIIREHGGEIQVSSEVGKGTKFRVILPVRGPDLT